ncbi:MAG: LysR family transcriptional regulator [Rhodoferax sp.]|nr:LysR family transcriptional regulator [Rhodoferax sp.]
MNIYTSYAEVNTIASDPQSQKRFDWNLIRTFLVALDEGSLLGAARVLHLSQPTVGRQVAELESQLGVVLFERTGRGLVPTAMAQQLVLAARGMESGALQLSRTLSGAQTQASGTVRMTASVPVAAYLVPPLLAAMRLALPEIQVELVSSNQVSNLLRREADIALRMVRPEQATLVARKVGEVGLGAYAHRSYLARSAALNVAADLLQHALIGSDTDSAILQGFHAMGLPVRREAFVLRSDDFVVQWQAIRAGLGVGFCADYMARTDPEVQPVLAGVLKVAPLPMWLAVHREIHTNQRIRAVFDFLAAELPKVL